MNNVRKLARQNQTTKPQGSDMKPVAKLGNDVKAKIGQQLRLMYDEIVEQGVPERFAEILRELDEPCDKGSKNEPT
jgi:Anti-sigma factor NepR